MITKSNYFIVLLRSRLRLISDLLPFLFKEEKLMRPDYKNWMPKGMVLGFLAGAIAAAVLAVVFGCTPLLPAGILKTVLTIVFTAAAVALWQLRA